MTLRKRVFILAALATVVMVLMVPGAAFAFDTVHGGYAMDTDACAGCHRAHTAASPITWTDTGDDERSALLISVAETNDEFCYTCHGSAALGADTNVWDGIFESDDGDLGSDELYNSSGEALNGGGFDPAMFPTQHYPGGATWVAWGAGNNGRDGIISMGGEKVDISCSACHDTHGSSNYRLLKDTVAGISPTDGAPAAVTVGGYGALDVPQPFVISAEAGYPVGGWAKGEDRMTQYTTYFPDFTDARYAKAPTGDLTKGISGWCQACHTQMNTAGDSGVIFDTNGTGDDGTGTSFQDYLAEIYDANDGFGLVERHRHPTNVALSVFEGASPLLYADPDPGDRVLPLANDGFGRLAHQRANGLDRLPELPRCARLGCDHGGLRECGRLHEPAAQHGHQDRHDRWHHRGHRRQRPAGLRQRAPAARQSWYLPGLSLQVRGVRDVALRRHARREGPGSSRPFSFAFG